MCILSSRCGRTPRTFCRTRSSACGNSSIRSSSAPTSPPGRLPSPATWCGRTARIVSDSEFASATSCWKRSRQHIPAISSSSHNDRLLALVECVRTLSDASRNYCVCFARGIRRSRTLPESWARRPRQPIRPFSVFVDRCSNACRNVCKRRKGNERHVIAHKSTCLNDPRFRRGR